ncbi:MAG: AtpZ/AtpI family protein [Candidatus Obscuribacterales bacterium]|nr:AtpZ/AtpI family protein [Candidatus Obscuribacterales bacterium]
MAEADKDEISQSSGPPGWVQASQWGMNLTVLTCFFGYAGFWIGERLGNNTIGFFLTILGIIVGFAAGIYRMVKASEKLSGRNKPPGD